ncbi:MAG TPA: phosphatase PAP2 family protein [Bacteroidales bacterium]|nr:phosphatase PAP2 family protein [Bacteroidales bacterium]
MLEFLNQIDTAVFLFLNGLNSPFMDNVMFYISNRFTWIPFYLVLIYLIIRNYKLNGLVVVLLAIVTITLSDQISDAMKDNLFRPRPCHEPDLQGMVHIVRGHCGGAYGFVSSHASNAFALATFMIFFLKPYYKVIVPIMLTFAVLKAYSRVYLGVHYPGDIIFGALLGILIGYSVIWFWKKLQQFFPKLKGY